MTMKLYDFTLSGHAHKARLFASLINADVRIVPVDLAAGEQKSADFLAKNSLGQVPLLEDAGHYIADSNAILVYLAKKYERTDWLPEEPLAAAKVQRWLSFAAGEIFNGPCCARLITLFGAPLDAQTTIEKSHAALALVDSQLQETSYITGANITIADIALYSYISSAPEGNVDLSSYENIISWLSRIETLPGFIPLEQSKVGLRAHS